MGDNVVVFKKDETKLATFWDLYKAIEPEDFPEEWDEVVDHVTITIYKDYATLSVCTKDGEKIVEDEVPFEDCREVFTAWLKAIHGVEL